MTRWLFRRTDIRPYIRDDACGLRYLHERPEIESHDWRPGVLRRLDEQPVLAARPRVAPRLFDPRLAKLEPLVPVLALDGEGHVLVAVRHGRAAVAEHAPTAERAADP